MHIPLYVLYSVPSSIPPLSPSWKMLSWAYRDNIERGPHLFCCYLFWLLPHHPYARMGRLYLLYREKKDQEKVKEGRHADILTVVAAKEKGEEVWSKFRRRQNKLFSLSLFQYNSSTVLEINACNLVLWVERIVNYGQTVQKYSM